MPPLPSRASAIVLRAAEAIGGELFEGGEDRVLDRWTHVGALRARGRGGFRQHLRHDGLGVGAGEGRLTRQHLVGHRAQGVHVAPGTDVALAHRLFGRHVGGRAEGHAGLGHAAAAGLLHGERDAEVGHEGLAILQQDVLGLDVAMDDAALVGELEGGRDFLRQADRVVDRQLLLPGEAGAEGLALDERHDVIQETIGFARIDQAEDVGVLEAGGGLDLGEEAVAADDGAQFGMEDLDGDLTGVLEVLGEVDGGHAALAELALEAVAVGERRSEASQRIAHGSARSATQMSLSGEPMVK